MFNNIRESISSEEDFSLLIEASSEPHTKNSFSQGIYTNAMIILVFIDELHALPHHLNNCKSSKPIETMTIVCLTIGTRGDVQPYIALCKELKKDGHRCIIATHSEYMEWIRGHGIEGRTIKGDPADLMVYFVYPSLTNIYAATLCRKWNANLHFLERSFIKYENMV